MTVRALGLLSRARPDRATFDELAHSHAIVPVWREVLSDLQTPVAAFARLRRGLRDAFLLESVEGGARWARYSFIGGDALAVVAAKDGVVSVDGDPPVRPETGEPPLAYLRRLLESCRAPAADGLPPLHGGAVGYVGYDCVREIERLPHAPPDDVGLPDLALVLTRTFVVFDHLGQRTFVITNVPAYGPDPPDYDGAVERCDGIVERLGDREDIGPLELNPAPAIEFSSPVGDDEFAAWVARSKQHIRAGDIFQVVPSRRFEARLACPPLDVYRALRVLNPSPYMYYLHFEANDERADIDIVGSSPEPMVRVSGDRIVTRPIAGTRPRGRDEDLDRALEQDLLGDDKERAEHVMLVDLARNDVGRVAAYGTVTVDEFMAVERYSHVMHIVSNVSARLAAGRSAYDAFVACFPAGTVSGAPKVRAMEIIDSFERSRRGPYAGAVGYFDFSGNLDTCITIRTLVATAGTAYVQAGAGIVADSDPDAEADETRRKAEGLLRAVAAARPSPARAAQPP